MWHTIVSSLESTVQLVVFGLVLMGSRHPLATVGIVLFFVLMIVMLVIESTETRRVASRSHEGASTRFKR